MIWSVDAHRPRTPIEQEVLDLLSEGRTRDSDYDVRNSPVATYLVQALGFDMVEAQLHRARIFFDGKMGAEEFIAGFPPEVIEGVTSAVMLLFDSRKVALINPASSP